MGAFQQAVVNSSVCLRAGSLTCQLLIQVRLCRTHAFRGLLRRAGRACAIRSPADRACSPGWIRAGRLCSSLGLTWAPGGPACPALSCPSLKDSGARGLANRATNVRPAYCMPMQEAGLYMCNGVDMRIFSCISHVKSLTSSKCRYFFGWPLGAKVARYVTSTVDQVLIEFRGFCRSPEPAAQPSAAPSPLSAGRLPGGLPGGPPGAAPASAPHAAGAPAVPVAAPA